MINSIKTKSALSLICGILSLSACGTAPKVRPHVLDTQLGAMREYKYNSEYNLVGPAKVHEIDWGRDSYGNGFICFPIDEASKFRRWAMQQSVTCKKR